MAQKHRRVPSSVGLRGLIVAETLGLTVDRINVVIGDTDVCPWDAGAHASRSAFVAGNSALYAAQQVREQILNSAADILDTPRDGLDSRAAWWSAPTTSACACSSHQLRG